MTRVKICGITTVEDALAAVELGADAIGLHFARTPREVTLERAAEIAAAIPPFISIVGIFTTEDAHILDRIRRFRLTAVQLHGDQSDEFARAIGRYCRVIRAVRVKDAESLAAIGRLPNASAYLLDSYSEEKLGGTGKPFNWSLAAKAKQYGKPIILAGGLSADNVADAIRTVKPYAVDASSRLESEPGRKDYEKMKEFIQNVRSANNAS